MRKMMTTMSSLLAGAMLLGACGGGEGPAEASETTSGERGDAAAVFCAGAEALYDQFVSAGTEPSSAAMQEVFASAQRLTPPDEIAADWRLILDSLGPLVAGQVNVDDPAAMEQVAANAAAYQRVGSYVGDTCGMEEATTTTTATP
jgi:hypothetical protein